MGSSSSRTKFDHTIDKHKIDGVDIITSESLEFDLGTIRNATNNFSAAIKLGEGRLGAVYKGVLPDGREIAVKRVPRTTCSRHEIKNEVELLLKIQHFNFVWLLGFCLEEEKGNQAIIFIYEYLPNRSLDKYIFDNTKKSYLDWNKRYKIIVGIARGLLYAHEDSRIIMIHGDLKATNILLDAEMNPKVADFGMSRFFHIYQTQGNSTRIGTIGYMAPEYLLEGFMSAKADVYSFGVLLLEIMSGKRITSHLPTPPHNLLGYAWNQWSEGTAIELIDPSLTGWLSRDEALRSIHIGLLCVQNKVEDRPTMREVVRMLNNDSYIAGFPFPSKPEFYRESITHSNMTKKETELDQCNTSSDGYVYDIRANESLQFDLDTIRNATNNFSASNKIGEGGFSNVYKGVLSGQEIAVKRVSSLEDFKNEVMLMHRLKLQHRNVVRVLGFYLEGKEKILIHEYVPNGSLDSYLFDNIKGSYLDWGRRHKIIGDIARGLLYLHEGSRFKIIHRDLKSQNILLDGAMNAKIADFGLAKLFVHHQTQGRTSKIAGTFGYMAPEYIRDGLISVKSDVFSFGILLLEIVSGRRTNSYHYFYPEYTHLEYVWEHWMNGSALDRLVHPSLPDNFEKDEVMRCIHIGLLCVQQNVEDRPTMSSVVGMLNDHSLTLEAPLQPAFCAENSSNITTRETELDQCNTSSDGYDIQANESLRYDLATIRIATSNFSDSYKISEAECGIVYKGVLWAQEIAVTRASSNSTLGFKGFKNELKFMQLRLQHPNLVRVLGFCQEGEEKLLIHEYVPNSSLDSYLFDDIKRSYLDWGKRYKIIGDIARGLLYLHEGSRFKIIHRNLKSQNILLDGAMNVKIANFGLAKLFVNHQTESKTCKIVGTLGYIAPEYVMWGVFSVKSDVFSFGILLLEIVSGQRTNSYHHPEYSQLAYVWKHWMNGSALDRLVDPSLHDNFGKDEVMRCIHIGLLCVQENVEDRPTMSSVVGMLNDHSFTLEAPSQLAFCAENSSNIATRETELEDSGPESCNSSPFNPR